MSAALPITVSYTGTNQGGNILVSFTITDANNNNYGSWSNVYAPTTSLFDFLNDFNEAIRRLLSSVQAKDVLPASGSIQYGFPAAVRPFDLVK